MLEKKHTILIFVLIVIVPFSHAGDYRIRLHQYETEIIQESDVGAEIRFGRQIAARLLNIEKLSNDKPLTRYINLIGTYLAMNSSRSDIKFYFSVLDSDVINAYSAPGGYVFITKAAINIAQDEAELAGILAHEIAHINARHVVNELNIHGEDNPNLSAFTRLLGASADTSRIAINQAVDSALQVLLKKGYKLQDELEADRLATHILAESGYDPTSLLRYINRVKTANSGKHGGSTHTHPSPKLRMKALERLMIEEHLLHLTFATFKNRFAQFVEQDLQ